MSRNFLIDYLGYWIVKTTGFFVRLLPRRCALFFGMAFGRAGYYFHRRRHIAYANLKAAFGGEKSPDELARIVRRNFEHFGKSVVEMLRFPLLNRDNIDKLVGVEGLERLTGIPEDGRGSIFLTAHFGNWELSAITTALKGRAICVLAREQKHARLNQLLDSYRRKEGIRVLLKGGGLRELVRVLKEGGTLAMLLDQDGGKRSPFVDFFGRPVSTPPGAIDLAWREKAHIYPSFIVRNDDGTHRLFINPPLEKGEGLKREKAVHAYLQSFAKILEDYIRRFPDQWLWAHKRWKSTPVRRVLVLNDGKTGHLRQSQAVCGILGGVLHERGLYAEVRIITPVFRSVSRRKILSMCGLFGSAKCQGCMRCLRFSLTPDSYRELMGAYADFVISCGSSVAPVNLFLSRENNARSVVLMKPALCGFGRFSLIIAPRHDRLPRRANIVVTRGAPNVISNELLDREGKNLRKELKIEPVLCIGVLLGGDTRDFVFSSGLADRMSEEIIRAADFLDANLLVTTSRRTPSAAEEIFRKRLKNHPRVKKLIIASEGSPENAVPGILGLSRVVVVSGDSVSMITEAVSSGRRVAVFPLKERRKSGDAGKKSKHAKMIEDYSQDGYLTFCRAEKLADTVVELAGKTGPGKKPDDNYLIAEALGKII